MLAFQARRSAFVLLAFAVPAIFAACGTSPSGQTDGGADAANSDAHDDSAIADGALDSAEDASTQPDASADADANVIPPTIATVVSSKTNSINAVAMIANDVNLYWTNPSVLGCAVGGCSGMPTTIATSPRSWGVAIDAIKVFWAQGGAPAGSIMSCALMGCTTPTVVATTTNTPTSLVLVNDLTLAWIEFPQQGNNMLVTCPKTGCTTPNPIVENVRLSSLALATDNKNVFYAQLTVTPTFYTVLQITVGGGNPIVLGSGYNNVGGITTDNVNVYWTTDKDVLSCAIGGCNGAPTVIATGSGPIVTDGQYVYWSYDSDALYKCPVTGCGNGGATTISPITDATSRINLLAIDTSSIFWFEEGTTTAAIKRLFPK